MTQFGNCNFSNADIQRLFITKWTTGIITDIDTNSVITHLSGLTESWDEIVINTVTVSYNQALNPANPNGINYTEDVTVLVPHSDISIWLDLVEVLTERYVIVFQDGNGYYWVMGWRFGTKVESYSLEANQVSLSFINAFSTALLTAISETYVNSNIL